MTKLLNIGLMRQDFYHVIRLSYAVMQLCSFGSLTLKTGYNYANHNYWSQIPFLALVEKSEK